MTDQASAHAMAVLASAAAEPAAMAELAAEVAARVDGVDAFEARADVRVERRVAQRGGVLAGSRTAESSGVGLRIFAGGSVAYVHTTDPTRETLRALAERGVRLAEQNARRLWQSVDADLGPVRRVRHAPAIRGSLLDASNEAIADVLRRAHEGAAAVSGVGSGVAGQAQGAFGAQMGHTCLIASNGTVSDVRSALSTLLVTFAARDGARLGSGTARLAGERGFADYAAGTVPESLGEAAAQRARESLHAVSVPSGRYRVLCDAEMSGTLAHESFGHLTEYDLVSSGWSTLRGRLGERLAAEGVSISDAPVSPGDPHESVAVPYDDEGTPGRAVTMLRDGVLASWMHTRDTARAAQQEAAGNARALDARFAPIVRMRNTFFEPGDATKEEALEALGDGLYLIGARGGAPHSDGSFMFTANRGYLVEGGRLTRPIRTASIHGNVLDFLRSVEMLTRDFEVLTNFFGGCGKGEQSYLPVGVGGPHVLVNDALVGGV